MDKALLLFACLIIPGVWGVLVSWLFLHGWPGHWNKGSAEEPEEGEPVPLDPMTPPADIWDYQI